MTLLLFAISAPRILTMLILSHLTRLNLPLITRSNFLFFANTLTSNHFHQAPIRGFPLNKQDARQTQASLREFVHSFANLSLVSISRSILIDIEDLNKLTSAWKEQEAKDLQDIVKRRIDYIQVGCACSGTEANLVNR